MMKRSIVALILAGLLLGSGCRQAGNNPLTEDIFKVTVEKQVTLAKQQVDRIQLPTLFTPPIDTSTIIFAQNDEGNAGELYWAALKNNIDPRAESTQKFVDQMTPVVQVFSLTVSEQERTKLSPASLEPIKAEAQKAADLPELLEFEKGAQRKNSRIVGELIPIPDNILEIRAVPGNILNCYAAALMCKALVKESAGDKAAAEKLMQTIVAYGTHLSKDPNYQHFFAGQAIIKFGCVGLKHFYERNNDTAKKDAVAAVEKILDEQAGKMGQLQAVDENKQPFNVLNPLGYLDEGVETLAKIAANETVPAGFRAKAIENLLSGYTLRYQMAERSGRPAETTEYAPPSDARLGALQRLSQVGDKTLAQMAAKSEQILTKMKAQNSGERMKYWREVSKPKAS